MNLRLWFANKMLARRMAQMAAADAEYREVRQLWREGKLAYDDGRYVIAASNVEWAHDKVRRAIHRRNALAARESA